MRFLRNHDTTELTKGMAMQKSFNCTFVGLIYAQFYTIPLP